MEVEVEVRCTARKAAVEGEVGEEVVLGALRVPVHPNSSSNGNRRGERRGERLPLRGARVQASGRHLYLHLHSKSAPSSSETSFPRV